MHSLTTGEVARYCGVNLRTVIRWVERGHLPTYKLPGRGNNRVRVVDFLNFIERHRMPWPLALHSYSNRVLIVDDDPAMAASIARTLNAGGWATYTACDGFRAGDALRRFLPAAMTLDLNMPGMDGFEVLAHVRQDPDLARLKVLVLTALPETELQRAISAGADDALAKPFAATELLARLDTLLPGRSGACCRNLVQS